MYSLASKFASKVAASALLLTLASGAHAVELLNGNFAPYLGGPNGIESDDLTVTPYEQSFTTVPGAVLDKIVWWGSYQQGSSDSDFEVFLNSSATALAGTLQVISAGNGISQYTLDVADTPLTATKIAIWNKSPSVQWYWQAISSDSTETTVAFSLQGSLIPEPGTWALTLGGLALLPILRRRPVH